MAVLRLSGCVVDLVSGDTDTGVTLSETERALLAYLAAHPGEDISRQRLLVEVFGYNAHASSRTADTTVRRLRAKVDPSAPPAHILTVYGVGYRFLPRRPVAPLLGRASAQAALAALLVPGSAVTVVGLPGVGKSRLLEGLEGATVLTIPSAFTLTTGKDHWHALVRARAIETQSFVIAPGQHGQHDDQGLRNSYGHSMIVDPWGHIVAMASDGPGLALAEIDPGLVQRVRRGMPVASHRRF